jgi:hypothetical protein
MAGDGIALDVTDAALVLALGARPVWSARARQYLPVAAKRVEAIVEAHLARLGIMVVDQRHRVVQQQLACEATEMPECALQAVQPRGLPLVQKGGHVDPPRIPERGHEQVHLLELGAQPHALTAKVDLQLVPRWRFKPDRRCALRQHLLPQVGHGSLHGAQAHLEAEFALQVLAHDVAVAVMLQEALLQPLRVRVQAGGSRRRPVWLPAALAQVTPYRVAAAPQLRGYPFSAPSQ